MDVKEVEYGRSFIGRLTHNMEAITELKLFAAKESISTAVFSIIGSCKNANISYYDQDNKKYIEMDIDEPMEILSCIGNATTKSDNTFVHAHVVLSKRSGRTVGGHLNSMKIFAGELHLQEIKGEIKRVFDYETGLNLMDL